jgi:hypothetical protein
MKPTKPHKIQIRNKEGSEEMTTKGMNCQVLLDGEPVKFCKSFKFEVEAGGMGLVTMQMYAEVEMDVVSELEKSESEPVGTIESEGKQMNLYTLSSPFPLVAVETESQ